MEVMSKNNVYYLTQNSLNVRFIDSMNSNNVLIKEIDGYFDLLSHLMSDPCDLFVTDESVDTRTEDLFRYFTQKIFSFKKVIQLNTDDGLSVNSKLILSSLLEASESEKELTLNRLKTVSREYGPKLASQLMSLFLEKKHEFTYNLNEAIQKKDYVKLSYLIHNLKSTSANLGFYQISNPCEYIDRNLTSFDEVIIKIFSVEIQSQYAKAELFLLNHRASKDILLGAQ